MRLRWTRRPSASSASRRAAVAAARIGTGDRLFRRSARAVGPAAIGTIASRSGGSGSPVRRLGDDRPPAAIGRSTSVEVPGSREPAVASRPSRSSMASDTPDHEAWRGSTSNGATIGPRGRGRAGSTGIGADVVRTPRSRSPGPDGCGTGGRGPFAGGRARRTAGARPLDRVWVVPSATSLPNIKSSSSRIRDRWALSVHDPHDRAERDPDQN